MQIRIRIGRFFYASDIRQTRIWSKSCHILIQFLTGLTTFLPVFRQTFIRNLSDFTSESDKNLTRHVWYQKLRFAFFIRLLSENKSDSCQNLMWNLVRIWCGILSESDEMSDKNLMIFCWKKFFFVFFLSFSRRFFLNFLRVSFSLLLVFVLC